MKIIGSVGKTILPQQAGNRIGTAQQSTGEPRAKEKIASRQKVQIPQNFEPKVKLNKKEQAYFEELFPKARKEIRIYLNQQQKAVPEKGKFVDIKG